MIVTTLETDMYVLLNHGELVEDMDWINGRMTLIGRLIIYEDKAHGVSAKALAVMASTMGGGREPEWVQEIRSDTAKALKVQESHREIYARGSARGGGGGHGSGKGRNQNNRRPAPPAPGSN
jgi:hypothetical protein